MQPDNRCTYYFNGNWLGCCVWHDWQCEEAWHRKDAVLRLKADRELRDCVRSKGHPIHAAIMYAGARAWYWTRWKIIGGI